MIDHKFPVIGEKLPPSDRELAKEQSESKINALIKTIENNPGLWVEFGMEGSIEHNDELDVIGCELIRRGFETDFKRIDGKLHYYVRITPKKPLFGRWWHGMLGS